MTVQAHNVGMGAAAYHLNDTLLALHCLNGIGDRTEARDVELHLLACKDCLLRLIQFRSMQAYAGRPETQKYRVLDPELYGHISELNLERYHLGMVTNEQELTKIEEHLVRCPPCAVRGEAAHVFVNSMLAAIVSGDFDPDWLERNSPKTKA